MSGASHLVAWGLLALIERAGEAAKLPFPVHPHMLRHFNRLCLGWQGHGHKAIAALLGPRLDHKHRTLHSDEPGAIQGYLALAHYLNFTTFVSVCSQFGHSKVRRS